MKTRNRTKTVVTAAAMASLVLTAASADAAIVQATAMDDSRSFFDGSISMTDLINLGSPSAGTPVISHTESFGPDGPHDGDAVHNGGLGYWGGGAGHSGTVTLTYPLVGSVTGYDITSINTIYGWNDSRERHVAQRYDVEITTVSNPTFTLLDSVVFDPYLDAAEGSTQVTLTEDTTGVLASGVTGLRFTVFNDPGSASEVGVIREYDVFGSATVAAVAAVPEPATLLIATFGLLGMGWLGWRRRRRA